MRLKFWVRQGFETFGMVLGASLLFCFLMFIQHGSSLADLLIELPLYLLLFGAMMMIVVVVGIYKLSVPLAISFGSTRNEVLLGLQILRLISTILIPCIAAILTAVNGADSLLPLNTVLPLGIGVFLLTGAVGSILGVIFTKYGKIATVITVISIMLVGFCAGILAALSEDLGTSIVVFGRGIPWLVLAAGLFLYAIAMIPEQRIVWKYNVKL